MKKFTTISGAQVGQEKEVKIDEKEQKIESFKFQIMKLMDDFLTIQSYGSARPEIMIPTRIVGKELFVEALQDLLKQEDNKKIIQVLESVKENIKDWKSIDDKIEELKEEKKDVKIENQIKTILEKWGSDEGSLSLYITSFSEKMNEDKKELVKKTLEDMISSGEYSVLSDKLKLFRSIFE
jgi:hypothetical protein